MLHPNSCQLIESIAASTLLLFPFSSASLYQWLRLWMWQQQQVGDVVLCKPIEAVGVKLNQFRHFIDKIVA